jgi:hypothetical protein
MPRRTGLLVLGGGNGKARILLGSAAVREKRRLAREIDRTIGRALRGDLPDSEMDHLEQLARLADRLARGGA